MEQEERTRPGVPKEYRGKHLVVAWEPAYCIHTMNCLNAVPEVFDVRRRPWILVDGASADRVAQAVMECPTGALHFQRLDEGEEEPVPAETTVQPCPNGPLFVRGNLKFVDAAGDPIRQDTRSAVCRCGKTSNTPFCDGTHRVTGFRAP